MDLAEYLSEGVNSIVKGAIKASVTNPAESIFMSKFALSAKKAQRKRENEGKDGHHIPAFLICSITNKCNLHCAGCYAWENHICSENNEEQLSGEKWSEIFKEATDIGVSFILLAGGEPLVRDDVIAQAGKRKDILFPIFTNGTMISDKYISTFKNNRNLLPVISLEGEEEATDKRRGKGVYSAIQNTMSELKASGIMFGTSITVTKENYEKVSSYEFTNTIYEMGCKFVIFVEYVPLDESTLELAFDDKERYLLDDRINKLRKQYKDMLFVSFPGDEKSSGGCLAAGRGFFHINSKGGCEPCPFSPYSDTNVRNLSLKEVLDSPLFKKLESSGALLEEHKGGCVLFNKREEVKRYEGEC